MFLASALFGTCRVATNLIMKYNILALCFFLGADLLAQNAHIANYYFNKTDDIKIYESNTGKIERESTYFIDSDDRKVINMQALSNGESSTFESEFHLDENEITLVSSIYPVVGELNLNKVILKRPGKEWRYDQGFGDFITFLSFKTSITTKYRTYSDCIAVKEQFHTKDFSENEYRGYFYIVNYYARNIGLVARRTFNKETNVRIVTPAIDEIEFIDANSVEKKLGPLSENEIQQDVQGKLDTERDLLFLEINCEGEKIVRIDQDQKLESQYDSTTFNLFEINEVEKYINVTTVIRLKGKYLSKYRIKEVFSTENSVSFDCIKSNSPNQEFVITLELENNKVTILTGTGKYPTLTYTSDIVSIKDFK